jgi:hypothetical protein
MDRGGIQEAPKLNTPQHQKNIKLVLKDHRVKWKVSNGRVMIQRKMMIGDDNRILLWNCTSKANDPDYMIKFTNYKEYERRFMKKWEEDKKDWEEQKKWEKEWEKTHKEFFHPKE